MSFYLRSFLSLGIAAFLLAGCGGDVDKPAADSNEQHDHADHDHADHAGHDHADHSDVPAAANQVMADAVAAAAEGQAAAPADDPHAHPDHFIVAVNGVELGHDELNGMVQQMIGSQLGQIPEQMRQQFVQQMMPRMQQQAVDRFIAGEVLAAAADKQKLEASDEEVATRIAELRKQLPPEIEWEKALAQMGTSEEALRKDIAKEMKIRALLDKHLESLAKPTDAEMKAVYDEAPEQFAAEASASARHILVTCEADADEATKAAKMAEIKKLRQEIVDGADFAEIAKAHSECPSKNQGGDLGTFGKGQMVPPFEKAVFSQELNKVGDVVETRFGYHLIEVTKREEGKQKAFAEVKEQIASNLTRERDNKAIGEYITALRDDAKITYGEGHEPPPEPAAAP